jgi:formylglycine-generating enzyme required for sulfatase activity
MSLKKMLQLFVAMASMSVGLALGQVTGSGFFITTDGYFVTNQHVVDSAKKVAIRTVNGKTYSAEVVRVDTANDLALLKAEGIFRPLPVQTSQNVRRGDKVFTLGFPNTDVQGVEPKYTEGVISSLTGVRDEPNSFQISVSLQPGNSGGPLISSLGNVVGIVAAKLSAAAMVKSGRSLPENVNYAVKSNYLIELISTLSAVRGTMPVVRTKIVGSMSDLAILAEAGIGLVVVETETGPNKGVPPKPKTPPVTLVPPSAGGRVFKDCDDCPEMVVIASGSFLIGSKPDPFANTRPIENEQPQHAVSMKAFALGKYEVTQEQWYVVMGTMPSKFKGRTLPVEQVSWNDANEFVKKLSEKTGQNYRLPSEAEWEYAARAGSQTAYSFGDNEEDLGGHAWFSQNSNRTTHSVGEKLPNVFGLHDMHGNVSEWTQDCWNDNYSGAPIHGGAWVVGDCSRRVVRGGAWSSTPHDLRSTYRNRDYFTLRYSYNGFRVARDN